MFDPAVSKSTQQVAGKQLVKAHDAEGSLQGDTLNTTCIASKYMLMECMLMEHVVGPARVPRHIIACQHMAYGGLCVCAEIIAFTPDRLNHP